MSMRYKILFSFILLLWSGKFFAQQNEARHLRIADTLTTQEKTVKNPVLLQSELDSLIKIYVANQPVQLAKEPVKESNSSNQYLLPCLFIIIALLLVVLLLLYRHQQRINRAVTELNEKTTQKELVVQLTAKDKKGRSAPQSLESRINDLNAELHKLSKENEGLNRVIKEYNGIQHEYDSLRHGILRNYKIKNYPGYDKTKDETWVMQAVLETENTVAAYAYEKFLKPILFITDANKNSPAKLSQEDGNKLLDLLISLSLLYIEYLYLRVNELSVGGKMVERIKGFSKGSGVDASLLKKLDTEFGSRALVIRMALDKAALRQLTYPVFDETNLNNQ